MKTSSAIASAQQKMLAAVFGIFFAAAVFLCLGKKLFPPLGNEFDFFFRIALAAGIFSLSFLAAPNRKRSGAAAQFLFILLLDLAVFLFLRKRPVCCFRFFIPLAPAGWIAGMLRNRIVDSFKFSIAGWGGMTSGVILCWFLSIHWEVFFSVWMFAAALVIMLWIVFRMTGKFRFPVTARAVLMILWLLPIPFFAGFQTGQGKSSQTDGVLPPLGSNAETTFLRPSLVAEAGLQPDKKDLKILLLGDDKQILEQLRIFPLTRKLVSVSLRCGSDLYRLLNALPEDFDLIVLLAPCPDSLAAERFYSIRFYQLLRDRLLPHGVLTVWLPEDALVCRKKYVMSLYGSAGASLQQVFPLVKPADRDSLMLLCGENNVTNSPDELNRRGEKLLRDSAAFPEGVFLMNTGEEIQEQERIFRLESLRAAGSCSRAKHRNELMRNWIRSHPYLDRTAVGDLLDCLRKYLLFFLIGLTVVLLAVRYFCSGRIEQKRKWLSQENGLFTGLVMIGLMTSFQQSSGRLSGDWLLLSAILLLAFFCGVAVSAGRHPRPVWKTLLALSLLLPLCGLDFLSGNALDPLHIYPLTGYAGCTAGMISRELRSEIPMTMLGFAAGLILGSVLYWLPGGTVFAVVLAVLVRIPPIAAENLQKIFEKRRRKYNIP